MQVFFSVACASHSLMPAVKTNFYCSSVGWYGGEPSRIGSLPWAKSSHLGDYVPRLAESKWRSQEIKQRREGGRMNLFFDTDWWRDKPADEVNMCIGVEQWEVNFCGGQDETGLCAEDLRVVDLQLSIVFWCILHCCTYSTVHQNHFQTYHASPWVLPPLLYCTCIWIEELKPGSWIGA